MCLRVLNRSIFYNFPQKAKRCIIVYKHLLCSSDDYKTPTMFAPIVFKDGMCVLKASFKFKDKRLGFINEGIHAYIKRSEIHDTFAAVIPKGAKFFVGDNGDIVSTKLIIFKDPSTFMNYLSKHRYDYY